MTNYIVPILERASPYFTQIASQASLVSKAGSRLVQGALLYQLYDSAIANMLCLDTLRHGTSLSSVVRINLQGAKPEMSPSSLIRVVSLYTDFDDKSHSLGKKITAKLFTPLFTTYYSIRANARDFGSHLPEPTAPLGKVLYLVIEFIASVALGIFSPTVKFRFTPEEREERFLVDKGDDDAKGSGSLYTTDEIETSHLGISGSLRQGLNSSLVGRIKTHPGKFVLGLAQLTAAVALTSIWVGGTSVPVLSTLLAQHRIKTLAALWISTW